MKSLLNLFSQSSPAPVVEVPQEPAQMAPVIPPSVSVTPPSKSSTADPLVRQDMAVLSHLSPGSVSVLEKAQSEAKNFHQPFIEPMHVFLGLLSNSEVSTTLNKFSVDISKLIREIRSLQADGKFTGEPVLSEESKQIFEEAYLQVKKNGSGLIEPNDLLLAIFSKSIQIDKLLERQGVKGEQLSKEIGDHKVSTSGGLGKYGADLTKQAQEGKLDPVAGRDEEIDRVIHILLRRTKNNPIIIGEAGVGKTAIVDGLAQMVVAQKVPQELIGVRIISLSVSSLVAGASHRGEFEERFQNVIKEAMDSKTKTILFMDEIHTLMSGGENEGSVTASNILKPFLSSGDLQVIGATTTAEYRRYFEKDRAFSRRFQPVLIDEPSEEKALVMIDIIRQKYEQYHQVTFSPEALKAAVHLSKRYVGERLLPDKAIDLLDEAAANVKIAHQKGQVDAVVKPEDVEKIVSQWTGIPITRLTEKEGEKLLHLEDFIHKSIISQNRAVTAVAEAVRRGRIGLSNAQRPIASFIFLGPTGVGKTELAKTLAEIMFGSKDAMIRLDMSEFMEKHTVAKLLGAPPGYVGYEEGGQLTEAVRLKPYSIVLLDEVEKAHPDVFNILLQILEDGRLTDNKGNTVSFKNVILIATSNLGSDLVRDYIQKKQTQTETAQVSTPQAQEKVAEPTLPTQDQVSVQPSEKTQLQKMIMTELSKFFRPELLNRFDEIVIFEPLTTEDMTMIVKLGIENTRMKLKEQDIQMEISQTALAELAKEGYDPVYGARSLRRLIQTAIENPISVLLINHGLFSGEIITIDYDSQGSQFVFKTRPQTPPTSEISPATDKIPETNSVTDKIPGTGPMTNNISETIPVASANA